MSPALRLIVAVVAFGFCSASWAEEGARPDHYEGEPAESMEQALANLGEYNARLQALLAEDEVDLHTVHELSYTLENALHRIQAELEEAAVALEDVHVASEDADADTVKARGQAWLQATRALSGE